ncbi:3655_t:CDS:2, partial [Entrophospora sp. SA101]
AVLIRTNLDCPDGYICQYTRRNPLEVYVDVNNFGKSLDVLVEIIYAKLLVLQTMKVVNDSVDGKSNVTRWKKQAKSDRSNITTIPDVHPSPKR